MRQICRFTTLLLFDILQKKRNSPSSKNRQNSNITFTHLRDLYGEKKVTSLIDRVTGAVDVDMAAQQFPNLTRELFLTLEICVCLQSRILKFHFIFCEDTISKTH